METGKLAAGNYEVNATALAESALCWLARRPRWCAAVQHRLADRVEVAETTILKIKNGQRVHEYCAGTDETSGDSGGDVLTAGLTAVRLVSASAGALTAHTTTLSLTKKSAKLLDNEHRPKERRRVRRYWRVKRVFGTNFVALDGARCAGSIGLS